MVWRLVALLEGRKTRHQRDLSVSLRRPVSSSVPQTLWIVRETVAERC